MASSPTSSSQSSHASPFSSSRKFTDLPVMALRDKIVEKIQENRVTLIVGETGCGKSSQVPQFLLEENMEPILCTQPRRFAVVAVARMVAKARNCEVGGEVGYHIGHSRVYSQRSKIVFKTAGVVLDEMREKGLTALKYKAIILDEVHERSVESDLVLVCVKQFLLKNNDLRVVLMSATADIARYRDYFKDLGRGERVEVLAIPSSGQHTIYQRRVSYLEQVTELLGVNSGSLSFRYCSGPTPYVANAGIKAELHKLIHDLVLHIHKNEPDIEKSILVFLPTYRSLEQQWSLLKPFSTSFKVHILHRSIDIEEALMAMKIWKSHRKVILATNIAESSVTIPKVAFVIDSCRSLQVLWDSNRKMESSELIWVSNSQAEQRKGRTGRTCDGQIYRLVTRSFFSQLQDYECPAILRLSLRQQVLLICCAESKAINDSKVLFQKALDPPDPEIVEDALSLLVHIRALEKTSPRGRYEPTFYGRLLASFSLSFDASILVLKFGDMGMLREGILLGILMDTQPLPILRPFGKDILFGKYTDCYYSGDNKNNALVGRNEVLYMANLCAFQFWQCVYKDELRLRRMKQHLHFDEVGPADILFPQNEKEWCSFHNLVQPSLHGVAETYEDILSSIHRFRPKFLSTSNGLPSYYESYDFQHACILSFQHKQDADADALATDGDDLELLSETVECISVPFVPSNYFQSYEVAEKLATIIKEMRVQRSEDISGIEHKNVKVDGSHVPWEAPLNGSHVPWEAPLCTFFVKGLCSRGNQCSFSHSLQAKRPVCKFFFSLQGCRNGDTCVFSHDGGPSTSSSYQSSVCLPEDDNVDAASLLRLFPTSSDGCILLLDDTGFHISLHLSHHYDPSKIITTTSLSENSALEPSPAGVRIHWGLSHPYQTIKAEDSPVPWNDVACILWFPKFDSNIDNLEAQKSIMQTFFEYLAIRLMSNALLEVQAILIMNNIRFSQLQVEKLGRESFFFLSESFPFDESSFGKLSDTVTLKKPLPVSKPVSYVFSLNPPYELTTLLWYRGGCCESCAIQSSKP
ncbi:DExH-box ATP-dependent RNA helicase DExH8 [Actinidia eriantha]|uniref:DExH-box ATP-dependent RNA helicase DExH8 n=1 Tax=Actinidia eriantha TaxID=165200 RepID=UPI00258932DE|nr:DExH-box ATP-dependent RNA helicase DExH8 [Actinidia eriantha]